MIPILLAAAVAAQPAPRVQLDLVGRTVDGGVELGLRYRIAEGWHIYWENPGDSGMATTASIQGAGWTAGPLRFPGPTTFTNDGLVTYGYEDEVVLVARLDGAGGPITVSSTVLVCREICEPETATATLDPAALPVGADVIAAAVEALPTPARPDDAAVSWDGDELSIRTVAERAELFPSEALDLATGSERSRFVPDPGVPSRDREEIVKPSEPLLLSVRVRTQFAGETLLAVLRLVRNGVVRDVILELRRPDGPPAPAPARRDDE